MGLETHWKRAVELLRAGDTKGCLGCCLPPCTSVLA